MFSGLNRWKVTGGRFRCVSTATLPTRQRQHVLNGERGKKGFDDVSTGKKNINHFVPQAGGHKSTRSEENM